jgi:Holliday junction resolvasome RuvABC endonuclease subunit
MPVEIIDCSFKNIVIGIDAGFRNFGISIVDVTDNKFDILYAETITTKRENKKRNIKVVNDDVISIKHTLDNFREAVDKYCRVHDKILVAAELPVAGAKSSLAAKGMAYATCMVTAFVTLYDIPAIWVEPRDVKRITSNKDNASKMFVMCNVVHRLGGDFKHVEGSKHQYIFSIDDEYYTEKEWEHIADSIGAIWHAQTTEQYKLWIN